MFKPRLRISRACASRLSVAAPRPSPSSPFAVPARQQQQHLQKRSLHASPARPLHSVPVLTDDYKFEREGLPGLLSPGAVNMAWTNYQAHVMNKLNEYTAGTKYADMTTLEVALETSREPHLAATFNHASMAHNNHFFFDGLSKTGGMDKSEHMSKDMQDALEKSFGSIETLQREMLLTADAMFGPGFVWLVQQVDAAGARARPFRILTTYQAGSPYPRAHWRSQGSDMNNHGAHGPPGAEGQALKQYFDRQNMANRREPLHGSGLAADPAEKSRLEPPPGGTNVVPVLCVNTWEHVWMWDYGVGGRMDFLVNWWDAVNWGRVESLSNLGEKRAMTDNPQVGPAAAQVAQPAPAPTADGAVEGAPQ